MQNNKFEVDFSKYDYPKEIWSILPNWEVVLKVSTFLPLILFGIVGNALLLMIIAKNRVLRTPTNLLIGNMAVADLASLLICPVMFMFHDFYQNYQLFEIGCKLEGFLLGSLLITGVLNLCCLSYDRLTAIVLPRETRLNIRSAKIVLISTWVIGFGMGVPLIIYRSYQERHWKNFIEKYCSENPSVLPMYWHVLIGALVWMPLAIMVVCYSAILWKLDRYEQEVLKRENPISVSYKTKVVKMLFIVLVTFVILRVPFTALVFVRNKMLKESAGSQIEGSFQILWYTSHYLIFLNAAVNPIIYGLTNDKFRRVYRQTPFLNCLIGKWRLSYMDSQHLSKKDTHTIKEQGPTDCYRRNENVNQLNSMQTNGFISGILSNLTVRSKNKTVLSSTGNILPSARFDSGELKHVKHSHDVGFI